MLGSVDLTLTLNTFPSGGRTLNPVRRGFVLKGALKGNLLRFTLLAFLQARLAQIEIAAAGPCLATDLHQELIRSHKHCTSSILAFIDQWTRFGRQG